MSMDRDLCRLSIVSTWPEKDGLIVQEYPDRIIDGIMQIVDAYVQEKVDRAVLDSAGDYLSIEKLVRAGIDEWAVKLHNRKWFKKIDGTPILNDLMVNITQSLAANRAKAKTPDDGNTPGYDHLHQENDWGVCRICAQRERAEFQGTK